MDNLIPCPFCGGNPDARRVGDRKHFFVFFCSACGLTPVKSNEARLTIYGAKMAWNRSCGAKMDLED